MTTAAWPRVLDLREGEVAVHAADAGWRDSVRPRGWSRGYATLTAERTGRGWIRLRWRCDPGDSPPAVSTMFRHDERVAVPAGGRPAPPPGLAGR